MKTKDEIIADAEESLRSVGKLVDCPEFRGFFLSLVRRRRDMHDHAVLHDGSLSAQEREIVRRLGRELEEVLKLHEVEAAMAKREIAAAR